MNEKQFEDISSIMDGEQSVSDKLYAELKQDGEARACWERYHLIRDVLGNHTPDKISLGLADRVAAQLADEPTILAPKKSRFNKKTLMKQASGMAIAATVATVAIISVQNTQVAQQEGYSIAKMNPPLVSSAIQQVSAGKKQQDMQSRLNGYIVNHNEYSVSSRMQGMLPYMRIIGNAQNKRKQVKQQAENK